MSKGNNFFTLSLGTNQGYVDLPYYGNDDERVYRDLKRFNHLLKNPSQAQLDLSYSNDLSEGTITGATGFLIFLSLIYLLLGKVFLLPILRAILR